jgi:hypothetical protein
LPVVCQTGRPVGIDDTADILGPHAEVAREFGGDERVGGLRP